MSIAPPDEAPETTEGGNGKRRRVRVAAAVVLFLPLLFGVVKMPEWIHDRQMDALADRFLSYPPPLETGIDSTDFHGSVAAYGMKDMCTFRLRFDLNTELPAEEIARYYETANIAPSDGGSGSLEIRVWTPPRSPSSSDASRRVPVIVEIQDRDHGSLWDLRCM
ncbi:hypothetical protein [Microtetraspora malaysiensis]|uniref:hypothetical protein n=1 Tax=Microtetraspora malaysiensis TaxID=161358 RepID=UPI003D942A5B